MEMEIAVKALFGRYERFFNQSLARDVEGNEMASLYAPEFIAATPAGIMAGKNDEQFKRAMEQGYAHYRAIGTKGMRLGAIRLSPIDDHHSVAHVAWTATYARKDGPDAVIDFDVHYLVRKLGPEAKVFGWISGDERELLKRHGIG